MAGNTTFFVKAADQKITWKDIFSDVFKKHNKEDGERLFASGTALTTPHESRMISEWKKPWLFARIGLFGIVFIALMFVLQKVGGQSTVYLMPLMFVGSIIMPLVVVLLMWEMNIPRNIPIYSVFGMFFTGGALSLIFAIVAFNIPSVAQLFADGSAHWAPLAEEPAKLLAICVFLWGSNNKNNYILNGILIGAAVGAGFAAIETMDYAFFRNENVINNIALALSNEGYQCDLQYMLNQLPELNNAVLLYRGILAPGGHVVWAALYGGALAMAKGSERLQPKHFTDKWFLSCFAASFALHFAWNHNDFSFFKIFSLYSLKVKTSQGLFEIPFATFYASQVILTVIAWLILLRIIKQGVVQCMRIPQAAPAPRMEHAPMGVPQAAPAYAMSSEIRLRGLSGMYKGSVFPSPSGRLVIGRDNRRANVVYPATAPGISAVHCEVSYQNGVIYLTDKNSSNGTFMADGTRLTPEKPYPLSRRSGFYLATRENMFEIE